MNVVSEDNIHVLRRWCVYNLVTRLNVYLFAADPTVATVEDLTLRSDQDGNTKTVLPNRVCKLVKSITLH